MASTEYRIEVRAFTSKVSPNVVAETCTGMVDALGAALAENGVHVYTVELMEVYSDGDTRVLHATTGGE